MEFGVVYGVLVVDWIIFPILYSNEGSLSINRPKNLYPVLRFVFSPISEVDHSRTFLSCFHGASRKVSDLNLRTKL